jgi:hypothetical protein
MKEKEEKKEPGTGKFCADQKRGQCRKARIKSDMAGHGVRTAQPWQPARGFPDDKSYLLSRSQSCEG